MNDSAGSSAELAAGEGETPSRDDGPENQTLEDNATFGVWLSGGGIRAALAAIGAVRQLIQQGHWDRIRYFVSVSGGSVVNGALTGAQSTEEALAALADLETRLKRRVRHAAALLLAAAGSAAVLIYPYLWGRGINVELEVFVLQPLLALFFGLAIFFALPRTWIPALFLFLGFFRVRNPWGHWQGVVVPLFLVLFGAFFLPVGASVVRSFRQRRWQLSRSFCESLRGFVNRVWRKRWLIALVLAVLLLAWMASTIVLKALDQSASTVVVSIAVPFLWVTAFAAILQFVLWPAVHRSFFDYIVGEAAAAQLGSIRSRKVHVFLCTDARKGEPAAIVAQTSAGESSEAQHAAEFPADAVKLEVPTSRPVIVVNDVQDPYTKVADERVELANRDRVGLAVQASTGILLMFPPVIPLRRSGRQQFKGHRQPRLLVALGDAGLTGTLGLQASKVLGPPFVIGNPSSARAEKLINVDKPDWQLFVDSAEGGDRDSTTSFFRPKLKYVPTNSYESAVRRIAFRSIVSEERARLEAAKDEVLHAWVTKARSPTLSSFRLRAREVRSWMPTPRQFRACVCAGAEAVAELNLGGVPVLSCSDDPRFSESLRNRFRIQKETTTPILRNERVARAIVLGLWLLACSSLKLLGRLVKRVSIGIIVIALVVIIQRSFDSERPFFWLAGIVIGGCLVGVLFWLSEPTTWRSELRPVLSVFSVAVLLGAGLGIGASGPGDLDEVVSGPAARAQPCNARLVAGPDWRNPWLNNTQSPPLLISHQGNRERGDATSVANFVAVAEIVDEESDAEKPDPVFKFFETDLRLAHQHGSVNGPWQLVADHDLAALEPAGPTVDELLSETRLGHVNWNFELKVAANAQELAAKVLHCALARNPKFLNRVCVSFGFTHFHDDAAAQLPENMCRCASLKEKVLNGDNLVTRSQRAIQKWVRWGSQLPRNSLRPEVSSAGENLNGFDCVQLLGHPTSILLVDDFLDSDFDDKATQADPRGAHVYSIIGDDDDEYIRTLLRRPCVLGIITANPQALANIHGELLNKSVDGIDRDVCPTRD